LSQYVNDDHDTDDQVQLEEIVEHQLNQYFVFQILLSFFCTVPGYYLDNNQKEINVTVDKKNVQNKELLMLTASSSSR